MEKIHLIQDFDVPQQRIFDFFSDHERLSEIYPGAFKRIVNSTDPTNANGVGSVRRITNFPVVIEETVTKYESPSLIEYTITNGGWPIKDHYGIMRFYELDNGIRTRMDYTIQFDSSLPMVAFIAKNAMQSLIGNALKELRFKFKDARF